MVRLVVAWFVFLSLSWVARSARADDLDAIRARGTLIWGADQEGGGPYVYPRDDDPNVVTGFEVELASAIARELGVRAQFFQGNWDKLPDLLRTREIDVVMNGYELSAERAAVMEASKPYYVYGLQLLVRDGDSLDWASLAKKKDPKRKIGVLVGSAADTLSTNELGDAVEVVRYEGNTDCMREVETKKLDATLQDTPIVAFYSPRFPALQAVGAPMAEGHYVLYGRKGETRLIAAIDEALAHLHERGELETLYRKYGLWNDQQKALDGLLGVKSRSAPDAPHAEEPPPIRAAPRKRGLAILTEYGGVLLQSAGMTVLLSVLSFPLAIFLGLLVALGRMYGPRWLKPILAAYVELLRGTPLMLQLYFIFFFLPEVGLRPSAMLTAVLGLAINYSAYESEIYRAGLSAVPEGQVEAALSLGLSRWQALRFVVLPQATRVVIPPVVNDFVALFKDTSVCSVITIVELTKRYSVLSMSTQATIELMILTAILYLAMSLPLSIASRRLEARLDPKRAQS
ncbi:MAG: ABC transporter permease subunit [Polyangiaceae bacterium]|nr:ABC transporter permease subunit [Polyangiaceae bacterium]